MAAVVTIAVLFLIVLPIWCAVVFANHGVPVVRGLLVGLLAGLGGILMTLLVTAMLANVLTDNRRYTGRVVSVADGRLCIGPNTVDKEGTCGGLPAGVVRVPREEDCLSLRARESGGTRTWHQDDLEKVSDQCR